MSANLDVAVDAFRQQERVALLLDKKAAALLAAMRYLPTEDLTAYLEQTAAIEKEYEEKRQALKL